MPSRLARKLARVRAERVQFRIRFEEVRLSHTSWGKTKRLMEQPLTLCLCRGKELVWEVTDEAPRHHDGTATAHFRDMPPIDATFFRAGAAAAAAGHPFQDKPAHLELKTRRRPDLPYESLCRHSLDMSVLATEDGAAYEARQFLFKLEPFVPTPSAGGLPVTATGGGGAATAAGRRLKSKRLSSSQVLADRMGPLKASLACVVSAQLTVQAELEERRLLASGGGGSEALLPGRVRRCGTDAYRPQSVSGDFGASSQGLPLLLEEEDGSMYSEHGAEQSFDESGAPKAGGSSGCCCLIS